LPQSTDRNRIQAVLTQRGIATGRYFPPIHLQPAWLNQPGAATPHLPVTESIARRTLALPFFNRMTPAQQQQIASALLDALRTAN
jgi:perosamine synthetase